MSATDIAVVALVCGLVALLLRPIYDEARAHAARTNCQSNLRQLAHAFLAYASDYDEHLPLAWPGLAYRGRPGGWICYRVPEGPSGPRIDPAAGSLNRYVPEPASYRCGEDPQAGGGSFAVNALLFATQLDDHARAGLSLRAVHGPARVALLLEEDDGDGTSHDGWMDPVGGHLSERHRGMGQVAFTDGGARALARSDLAYPRQHSPYCYETN